LRDVGGVDAVVVGDCGPVVLLEHRQVVDERVWRYAQSSQQLSALSHQLHQYCYMLDVFSIISSSSHHHHYTHF